MGGQACFSLSEHYRPPVSTKIYPPMAHADQIFFCVRSGLAFVFQWPIQPPPPDPPLRSLKNSAEPINVGWIRQSLNRSGVELVPSVKFFSLIFQMASTFLLISISNHSCDANSRRNNRRQSTILFTSGPADAGSNTPRKLKSPLPYIIQPSAKPCRSRSRGTYPRGHQDWRAG